MRKQRNLSQARLAELSGIRQHRLSAFELGKTSLPPDCLQVIIDILANLRAHAAVVNRRKRYRVHSYEAPTFDRHRSELVRRSPENAAYLNSLEALSAPEKTQFSGISLFSGCGGFSAGFRSAGCETNAFVEIDDRLSTIYSANFPKARKLGCDISKVQSESIERFRRRSGEIDVVFGGPPCQGFSLSGKRDVRDRRNYLFREYMRFVDIVAPKVAIIENVRLLTSMKSKDGDYVRNEIIKGFLRHGYDAELFSVNAVHYGVPQHRERVFFVATRSDLGVCPSFPEPEYIGFPNLFGASIKLRTFADACSDLEYIESGQTGRDPLHASVRHPDHVIRWLWDVPQGRSAHDNEDPELRPPSGYNTTYKRQVWNQPGATVQTTFGMISGCRNVHPIATRSLTIREAARLQSFPDDYKFMGPVGTIRTGIGNAVPPLLARALAVHVRTAILKLVEVSSG